MTPTATGAKPGTADAVASSYGDPTPHYRREPLAAVVDDRVVGIADLGFSIGDNEHLADLEIAVDPDHRRRGVGQAGPPRRPRIDGTRRLRDRHLDQPLP